VSGIKMRVIAVRDMREFLIRVVKNVKIIELRKGPSPAEKICGKQKILNG
jgi:hypothetical protein